MQISPINTQFHSKKGLNITPPTNTFYGQHNPSFGLGNLAAKESKNLTHYIAKGLGKIADWGPMQKLVDYLEPKNYQRVISAVIGVVLSSFYMIDTAKSKKIEKDQKMPLMINQGAVCALSTLGAYKLDGYLDKKLENFTDNFHIASMSDSKHQGILLQLKKDKANFELLNEASEQIKSPKQMINKQFLDKIANPEEFEALKKDEKLLKNEYAKQLIKELNESKNPKQLLEDNFNKTDDFMKELKESFRFRPDMRKSLEKAVLEGKADEATKGLLDDLKTIGKNEKNKAEKMTEMFLNRMEKSKTLQKMFSKKSFGTILNLISEYDKKLAVNKKGFGYGKSIMVFAMIYRFVSPVIATPIANSISSKIEAKKKAKKASAATPQSKTANA